MSIDPRAEYDAVADEMAATSSAITGKMFGMPCLKNNGKAFAGFYQSAMVFKLRVPATARPSRSLVPGYLIRQAVVAL